MAQVTGSAAKAPRARVGRAERHARHQKKTSALIRKLPIEIVECDMQLQPRARFHDEWVKEYAQEMIEGVIFDPVVVFHDGERYWLADGFHRLRAAVRAGKTEIAAEIREGTRREALLHSLSANAKDGHHRTNEDKQRSVEVMLKDPEWVRWSDREIARQIGVSHEMVGTQRERICQTLTDSRVVSRSGTTYTMKVPKSGRARDRGVHVPADVIVSQAEHVIQSPGVEPRHLIEEDNTAAEEDNPALDDLLTTPPGGAATLELPLSVQPLIAPDTKCYSVLYFDPCHTITTLDDLCAQPVPAADNCVLFVWATTAGLEDALRLMKTWGFDYKEHIARNIGSGERGYCVRNQHELLLVGVRGDAPNPIAGTEQPSITAAADRDHIVQFITEMFPGLPKAKLFTEKPWAGWEVWQPAGGGDDVSERQQPDSGPREGGRATGPRSCAIRSVCRRSARGVALHEVVTDLQPIGRPPKPELVQRFLSRRKKVLRRRPRPFSGPPYERRPKWCAHVCKGSALMNDTTTGPTRAWVMQATNCIKTAWLEQAYCHSSDREHGFEPLLQRRPDFRHRARTVAEVVANVVPQLGDPGCLSPEEYEGQLREPIYHQLPFLETHVREELARDLVAAHGQRRTTSGANRRVNAVPVSREPST